MELVYQGKMSEEAIIEKAGEHKASIEPDGNRSLIIKGDCYYAMASLSTLVGKVDLIYFDPPLNGFLSEGASRVKVKSEEYAEFLRKRLVLAKTLLSVRGSIYIHLPVADCHYMKILCDEIFTKDCFKNDIARVRSNPRNSPSDCYGNERDSLLFYVKEPGKNIWNDIRIPLAEEDYSDKFSKVDRMGRRYATVPLHAPGETKNGVTGELWRGLAAPEGRHWMTTPEELDRLDSDGRIEWSQSGNPRLIVYAGEYEGKRLQDIWNYKDPLNPEYPGEKNSEMLDKIIRQSSDKDSVLLDCFAGSGAFLRCAENCKRQYVGIDCSSEAVDMIMSKAKRSYKYFDMFTGYTNTKMIPEAQQLSLFDE